jgi:PUA domain protein
MAAGISGADSAIEEGDLVWIRDEVHKRPLALGWALLSGEEMVGATGGKAVKTIHWVGDELWDME